ncbi:protease [Agaricicola taiwanensis]|uniref:Protease n=1 Tax=Agaricicola taiwanensis TaxID=591372 RepID=A0A8J2VM36_9RHOB|nr:signal peptide peptidase SppA [Agaricicola taiwanensis]GGE32600.1 protease [Agaricicola taiwanensis]
MSLDADALVERRRLRRRASLWRGLALVLIAVALGAIAWRVADGVGFGQGRHIARVSVSGFIGNARDYAKMFRRLENSSAQGVILVVNSPGGGVTASEALYEETRKLAAKKPVVAVFESLAASGGYMVGLGADHIVARRSSITGSIGVLVQYPNLTGLLDTVGVNMEAVRSSPIKAEPDGFGPTPPEATAVLETLVSDSYQQFRGLVSERRNLTGEELDRVADGRVVVGQRALDLKLVDELGGEDEARQWLAREKGVAGDLPIVDWKPSEGFWSGMGATSSMAAALAEVLGWTGLAADLRRGGANQVGVLDGVLAVWHPSIEKQYISE